MERDRYPYKPAIAVVLPIEAGEFPRGATSLPWSDTWSKRMCDCLGAAVGLTAVAPVMAVVALVVRLTSEGPALYCQTRVGKGGVPFTMWKFRTMTIHAESDGRARWAQEHDPRVTPVRALLRKWRLDELPQLWNILRGEMSLVGPRPERPEFVAELSQAVPGYDRRHLIKPGLTGWAQVQFRYGATVEDARVKLQYDLDYVKQQSMAFDLRIVWATVRVVLTGFGAR